MAVVLWAVVPWAVVFWAVVIWAVVFWAVGLMMGLMVIVVVVGENNLGGCVAVGESKMNDEAALL